MPSKPRTKIDWDAYVRRRRIDEKKWLAARGIKSYKELVQTLKEMGIEPPPSSRAMALFRKKKPAAPKRKTKKPTRPKEAKVDEPQTGTASDQPEEEAAKVDSKE